MSNTEKKSPADLGELRRFEWQTMDESEREELLQIISEKKLSRRDIAVILFGLRVKLEFVRSDFGI